MSELGERGPVGPKGDKGDKGDIGPNDDQLFDTAMRLIEKLDKKKASKTTMIVVAAGLVLDVLLSAGYATALIQEHNDQVTHCIASNVNRSEDLAVWGTVLGSLDTSQPGETPAQNVARLRLFGSLSGLVAKKDALRKCASSYKILP